VSMRTITALCRSLDTADDLFVSSTRSQHGLKPRPLDQGWKCGEGDPPRADPEGLDLATLKLSILGSTGPKPRLAVRTAVCEGRNAPHRQCRQKRSERSAQTSAATTR